MIFPPLLFLILKYLLPHSGQHATVTVIRFFPFSQAFCACVCGCAGLCGFGLAPVNPYPASQFIVRPRIRSQRAKILGDLAAFAVLVALVSALVLVVFVRFLWILGLI